MNVRCVRCGSNLSLGREAVEAAVTAAAATGDKLYVTACPRCRQAIKIPIKQLRLSLPANWTPAAAPPEQPPAVTAAEMPAAEPPRAEAEQPADLETSGRRRSGRRGRASPETGGQERWQDRREARDQERGQSGQQGCWQDRDEEVEGVNSRQAGCDEVNPQVVEVLGGHHDRSAR
jgi:hypothetical protein